MARPGISLELDRNGFSPGPGGGGKSHRRDGGNDGEFAH
jgi:hypothetical protein